MKYLCTLAAVALLTGCASFKTTQTEVRNGETTEITTKATAWTLLAAKSALANWEAIQNESQQSAKVGALKQESQGGIGTNLVETVVRAAVEAATR